MKKFLTAFAGIAAAFASNASTAPTSSTSMSSVVDGQNVAAPQATVLGENITTIDSKGDQFNFVLKRSADTGLMMAYHSSHSSHASHSSHSSHYSSR
jgi:hypothetical protein